MPSLFVTSSNQCLMVVLAHCVHGIVRVPEMPLQRLPAVCVVLFLHFLTGLQAPFRHADHETAIKELADVDLNYKFAYLSNIKAMLPSPTFCGFKSALLAPSKASLSGPWALITLCKLAPAG